MRNPEIRPGKMARPLTAAVVAGALLLSSPARAERLEPADEPDFVQVPKQLAVKILRGTELGMQFVGSGFAWVSGGKAFAVTNLHVAAAALPVEPPPGGLHVGFAAPVHVHGASRTLGVQAADLAIIETDVVSPRENPYTLGTAALDETVYSISYDRDELQKTSPAVYRGKVVGIVAVLYPASVLVVTPPVPPDAVRAYVIEGTDCISGSSGGMVVGSRGEVVGYNTGTIGGGLCVVVPIEEVVRAFARRQ